MNKSPINASINAVHRLKSNLGKSRKGQMGLSILGALLALVIGALLTVPIVNAFLDSQRKTRVEANLQDMRTIIADVQRTFGTSNQYGALTTGIAVQSGVIPTRLRVPGTNTAQNSYNGDIVFENASISTTNDVIILRWNNVPKSDCADLVYGIEQLTRGVHVQGQSAKPNDGVIDAAVTASGCDTAANVPIQMYVGRKG